MSIPTKINLNIKVMMLNAITLLILFVFCFVAELPMVIPVFLFFCGLYLSCFQKASVSMLRNLGLLLAAMMTTARYADLNGVSSLYLPVASVAMLTMLLFNDVQLAFVMSLVSSCSIGLIIGGNLNLILIYFLGSLSGIFALKGARHRSDLIKAGAWVALMQVVVMCLESNSQLIRSVDFWQNFVRPLAINGFISATIVLFGSKIFEWLFGVLTNFSLLELADTNHPLLKRLALEAPGTYHHSLVVSNLSEAAADAIGANSLLVRVGAYYHDIGKLIKPEYFTENQLTGGNKHDHLEPSMSRLVILNHVKEGVELAKEYKLNPLIIDFIPQHHGTSLIYFFYRRALEDAENAQEVDEENFRYPGPKPQSKETAVVLLADSVEGATRSLDDPSAAQIDEVVQRIINNKFIDGQLEECHLTLKDIEKISKTFTRLLSAMYHGRIKYPDQKKNGHDDRHHKHPETHSPQFPASESDRAKNS